MIFHVNRFVPKRKPTNIKAEKRQKKQKKKKKKERKKRNGTEEDGKKLDRNPVPIKFIVGEREAMT
jgi:hypothetical protein